MGTGKTVCNGGGLKFYPSNNSRTSLVPAPAVIPALIVYFKVVAVKTLVVYTTNHSLFETFMAIVVSRVIMRSLRVNP